jgi:hypothetical protein
VSDRNAHTPRGAVEQLGRICLKSDREERLHTRSTVKDLFATGIRIEP